MNTEKITIERFIEETFLICDVSGVGQVKTMKPEMERIINVLLEQIRDDLKNEFDKGLEHSEYVVVDKVFNKYLNEKGGK